MFYKHSGIIKNTAKENEVAKYSHKILFGILTFIMESMKLLDPGKQLHSKGNCYAIFLVNFPVFSKELVLWLIIQDEN